MFHDTLIAYSLGNFVGHGTLNTAGVTGVTAILRAEVGRDGALKKGTLVPLTIAGSGIPRPDRSGAAFLSVRTLSRQDFGARAMRVSKAGAISPP